MYLCKIWIAPALDCVWMGPESYHYTLISWTWAWCIQWQVFTVLSLPPSVYQPSSTSSTDKASPRHSGPRPVQCLSLSLSASPTKWSARLVSCCRVAWSSSPISWLQEAPAKVGAGHWPRVCGSRVMWPHVYTEHWPVLSTRGGGGVIWHEMRRRRSVNIRSTSTVKFIRSNYKYSLH